MNSLKKMLIFVTLILCICFLPGCFETDLYQITEHDVSVGVVEYTGTEANLVTPTVYKDKEINELGYSVYSLNIYVQSVKITSNIVYIRACAFWYCKSLTTIYIPKSVNIIEPYAFHGCTNISDVYYEGSEEEFLKLFGDLEDGTSSNQDLFNANIHYNYSEE